jgi:hypothetical protein
VSVGREQGVGRFWEWWRRRLVEVAGLGFADRNCEKDAGTESNIRVEECIGKELSEVSGQLRSELAVEVSQFGTPK